MSDAKDFAGYTYIFYIFCNIHTVGFSLRPLASSSLGEASDKGLCGLVGSPDCLVVEEECCQIHGAGDGFSLRPSF